MLDEFSATRNDAPEEASKKEGYSSADPMEKQRASYEVTNDFSKQLQEQMAALMGSVDESPEMKQEIEAMLQELGTAPDTALSGDKSHPPSAAAAARSPEQPSAIEEPFQETIRKTMERIQASGEKATTAAKSEGSDEMLAGMLKEMQNSGSESTGDDEGFNKMLMGMMEQLTNKDILYDPMKELHDKFPTWMAKNRAETGQEDLKRYEEQQKLVKEIVCRFEQPDYSDSKTADREYIVERMQLVRGSPCRRYPNS